MLHIIFTSFVKKWKNIFVGFALIQDLIVPSDFNGYTYILLILGPVHFNLRDAIPLVAYGFIFS